MTARRIAMDKAPFAPLKSQRSVVTLAMDRAPSARVVSEDGDLHVGLSNISKATVNPYWGEEIPNYEGLGLDPKKKYLLLRHPKELAKASGTFNNLPILAEHQPRTSEKHPSDLVVGSTGTDAVYKHPYLQNSLVFWTKPAIDAIERENQKELSCAYHYDPVMTPGVYEGQRYDGVMTNIRGNHVALVKDGRAGADVVVQDAAFDERRYAMPGLTPAAMVARSALFTYLSPRLAQDSRIDFNSLVKGVNSRNYKQKRGGIALSVREAVKGKLAQDANIMDLAHLLDALSPQAEQADQQVPMQAQPPMTTEPNSAAPPMATQKEEGQDDEQDDLLVKIKAYLESEGVSPEILQNLDAFLAEEGNPAPNPEAPTEEVPQAPPEKEASPAPPKNNGDQGMPTSLPPATGLDENQLEDCVSDDDEETEEEKRKRLGLSEDEVVPSEQSEPVTKTAMDAAIKVAVFKAQRDTVNNQRNIRAAERFVRPWVGDLAMDSARPADVYRTALKALGMDAAKVDKMHPDALLPVLEAQPKPGQRKPGQAPRMAADAKIEGGSFFERFPDAGKVVLQ